MAKSLRSKVKRRWRALKRKVIEEAVIKPRCEEMNNRIKATVNGYEYRQPKKLNAFTHPDDPNAEFPQFTPAKVIDLRSAYIPIGGDEWVGARRKKVNDVQILVDNLHGEQTEFEQQEIDDIEQKMQEQVWEDEDEQQQKGDEIQEEGPSKRSLLKKIGKDKKGPTKNRRATKSKKLLTNF